MAFMAWNSAFLVCLDFTKIVKKKLRKLWNKFWKNYAFDYALFVTFDYNL